MRFRPGFRRSTRLVTSAAVVAALALVQPALAASSDPSGSARQQLVSLLNNVRSANGKSYQTRDSTGYTVDTIKIIQTGQSSYIGVYHVNQNGFFSVRVGTSSDLVNWHYVNVLEPNATQPTIAALSNGSYLVAYEKQEASGASHLEFRTYPTVLGLEIALSTNQFDAPRTLSSVAEGTPSIHDAALSLTLHRSTIHVGFHYYDTSLGVDRNARATLTNLSSWTSQVATDINSALTVGGNIGGRDSLTFQGYPFTVIEAQGIAGDWSSWRVYVWDETARTMTQLSPQTDAGSSAFANAKATAIVDPAGHRALVAAMFIPWQGSAGNEAGPLIYWNEY
jgi:hypothetical protein